MRSKVKTVEECARLFEIDVKKETIDKAFDEVYNEITKVANIPGFRIGKAPKEMVKKHYVKDAKDEVLKRLIPGAYRSALVEHKVNPIGLPEITDVIFEEDKVLSFKAKVDTRPKLKLKDYRGLKLERKKAVVTDEEVDKTLENLREMGAKYFTVEDRPVEMGDYIVSDMECYVDEKPVHKKRENLWLYVDKEALVPELSQGMLGMKKGETKEIDVALPKEYPNADIAGKRAKYRILAKEIKARKLPDLDDKFAREMGKETMVELKSEVKKGFEERLKMNIEIGVENQLLKKLMDDNVFSVPSSFVARQTEYMVEDARRKLEEKGFKPEELDKKEKELKDKFKDDAVRQVRLLFILDDIARLENIEVSDAEIDDAYKSIAAQTNKTVETVKGYYEKEDLVDSLKDKIREKNTIQFLLKNSQVVEV